MENHDEAYYLWRDAGVQRATLIHVDAHHDMWPTKGRPITVGSFIYRAVMEEIVGDIYWVVPDATFASTANVELLLRNLEKLPNLCSLKVSTEKVTASYAGHRVEVCAARNLPPVAGGTLLDIDVDYFVLPKVSAPETAEVPERAPWVWPQDLTAWLEKKCGEPKMITVAYSVNGGTTPIHWKYLGEEVRARLVGEGENLRYFDLLRESASATIGSEELLREAVALRPNHPAAHWRLAEVQERIGSLDEARASYRRAIEADERYCCVYASEGPCLEAAGRRDVAEKEYKRLLCIDPQNPDAMFGLGSVAATNGEWERARKFLLQAMENGSGLIDGHRLLGDVFSALDQRTEALSEYEKYCTALTSGKRSLGTPIATREPLEDVHEIGVRLNMAKLYFELGNAQRAEEEYRWLSERLVPNTAISSIRLTRAGLLWRAGKRVEAGAAASRTLLSVPRDAGRVAKKLVRAFSRTTSPDTPMLNIALNVARSTTTAVCSLVSSVIITRQLGPQAMGMYGYTLWVAGVMVALCHFGLPTSLSKFVAERLASDDQAGAASLARKVMELQLAIAIVVMVLGAAAFVLSGSSKQFPWLFAVLLVLPMTVQQAFTNALMGAHEYRRLAIAGALGAILQLLLVSIAAWIDGSVRGLLMALLISSVITAALYWPSISTKLSTPRDETTRGIDTKKLLGFAGPVAYLVMLDMVVWQRSETYFLKNYSLWQEIGFYSIAYLIVSRLNEALVAVTSTLMPLQSGKLAASGKAAVAEVQWNSLQALQMVLVPVCILSAVLAKPLLLLLYGSDYARVFPVLLVLLFSPLAVSMTDVSVASLYAMERQRSMVVPLTFTAALNIALAFLLVRRWGAVGAAAANSGAQLVEGSFLLFFSASALAARIPWRSLITIYASGFASFAPAVLATLALWPLVVVIGLSMAGCFGYAVLLFWKREIALNRWLTPRAALHGRGAGANA